ncbi:hypothetical protein BN873_280019 [Candidatus Competibacter denitrificans Run_A_D11]|uniref:CobQ/CobB/MinD/ParA nucleotide binding domain-containing protein n=1 Tax=Candidatus Competibacter denitrificans Run_A_D11 TaxID=1400863 RepID=W6MCZ2_9GAMM|nr:hypothetical protein [Candidatus Competibacter denitrificans]CDI02333.1 hypothetical protein BN873_280019 [Candidatus Competibacter denitrificans Run_A_D11]
MNRRAVFVLSNKGGAGKTTFARGLLDLYRLEAKEVAAYDADGKVGQLVQHYGQRDERGALLPLQDPKIGCGFFDIRADDDRDVLINALADEPERLLFDLPGGLVGELGKVIDYGAAPRGLFDEYWDKGYAITVVIVMTPVLASVRTVQESLEAFGPKVNYVVVKNLAFGPRDSFILFDGTDRDGLRFPSSLGKAAVLDAGGVIITMPPLEARSYALLDVFNLTFKEGALGQGRGRQLPLADRVRVRNWLQDYEQQIYPARTLLGLDSAEQADPANPTPAPPSAWRDAGAHARGAAA